MLPTAAVTEKGQKDKTVVRSIGVKILSNLKTVLPAELKAFMLFGSHELLLQHTSDDLN